MWKKQVYLNTSAPGTSHPQIYQEITKNLNTSSYYQEEKQQTKKQAIKTSFSSSDSLLPSPLKSLF